jgi:hypothetical protein
MKPSNEMRTIKATFANGDYLETSINGTESDIRAYYLGKRFNLGDGAGGDNVQVCIEIEFTD